jgi:TonB family protein
MSGEAVSQNKASSEAGREPYVVVEDMPVFPGGDSELLTYISEHTTYPESAKVSGIAGRVIIRFCVTEKGTVDKITVLKGVDPALDAEAVRVVSSLPDFVPGYQGGVAVSVWYMVPVTFSLKVNENLPPPPPPAPSTAESKGLEEEFSVVEENPDQGNATSTPSIVAEEMPMYPGGDAALLKYLSRNSRYPGEAKASGKEGRVIVRFCVTESGDVDLVSILAGVDPALDAEAIRVVSTLSGFKPAKQGGKPVPVWYSVPINFTII